MKSIIESNLKPQNNKSEENNIFQEIKNKKYEGNKKEP